MIQFAMVLEIRKGKVVRRFENAPGEVVTDDDYLKRCGVVSVETDRNSSRVILDERIAITRMVGSARASIVGLPDQAGRTIRLTMYGGRGSIVDIERWPGVKIRLHHTKGRAARR